MEETTTYYVERLKWREFEDYLSEFNSHRVPNIFENTRERLIVEHRQLFHTILRIKYKKSLQSIADFMTFKGRRTDHATIINSVKRTLGTNYYNSDNIAEIYDYYFEDKREERIAKMSLKFKSKSLTKLQDLIRDIPKEREQEIYELVLMRIKSWSWKSKDKIKVIEGV